MKITVLGSGASLGVPSAGGFWGRCDPDETRNKRSRASILVEKNETALLIDATNDLRTQLVKTNTQYLDALLLTHHHSDHTSGIDDLRGIAFHNNMTIPLYADEKTLGLLKERGPYRFFKGDDGVYVPFLDPKVVEAGAHLRIGDIDIQTFDQDHGTTRTLGFRFGDFAYSVDVVNLDDAAFDALAGVETWVVDAAGYHREHVTTHANFERIMKWVDRIKPKMTYLTVLTSHMDYKTLCDELPPHIRPAYDGLEILPGTNVG
ncbi:MAG: MBL fold metallo-hydrolase [Alphaproteobacteria bacterium]|nr:MBL fold metallo-hydrolase [Alphaproteobacteria bacterium]